MLAVVFPEKEKFELREVEIPKPARGQVLIKVKSTTICASDFKIFHGTFPGTTFPHIPGHEWSGEVVEVGSGVTGIQVGDRVGVEVHVGCGQCQPCMDGFYIFCDNYGNREAGHAHIGFTVPGGLAEYCAVSVKVVHKLNSNLDYDDGAFTDNVGVALHALERAGLKAGEKIVILGPGAFGLLAVSMARAMGAGQIVLVGTREERLALGRKLGADVTVNVREVEQPIAYVKNLFGGKGPDLAVEFAGTEDAAVQALSMVRRGGRVALGGSTGTGKFLNIDLSVIVRGHLDLFGSLANPRWVSRRALSMIEKGYISVKPLITHHMPLREFAAAWETFRLRKDGAIRVMLHPEE